jgi:hypothetical protein
MESDPSSGFLTRLQLTIVLSACTEMLELEVHTIVPQLSALYPPSLYTVARSVPGATVLPGR